VNGTLVRGSSPAPLGSLLPVGTQRKRLWLDGLTLRPARALTTSNARAEP